MEREKFERHENTFRDIFNEKILNLHNFLKSRLDSVEKKFVEKNLKSVTDRIHSEVKVIELVREELISKEKGLSNQLANFELNVKESFKNLSIEEDQILERSEGRLTDLEKQFNKRFLDYDHDFSNFKSVVIDEVEGLIKDVNVVLDEKVNKLDNFVAKSNFVRTEITKKFTDLNNVKNLVETEVRDIRDEVSDIKVKMDIMNYPDSNSNSMNDHVKYMREYENQIIALIKNLKNRGISEDKIK